MLRTQFPLDESTAALDARAEHELFTRIGELFANRSVLPLMLGSGSGGNPG